MDNLYAKSVVYLTTMVLLAVVALFPLPVRADITPGSDYVNPFAGFNFFDHDQNLQNCAIYGGRLGYNFTGHFGLEGTIEFLQSRVNNRSLTDASEGQYISPIHTVKLTDYQLNAIYHFTPDRKLSPFVVAGYGGTHYNPRIADQKTTTFDIGLGAQYSLSGNLALRFDLRDNMVTDYFNQQNISTTLGLVISFGGKAKTRVVAFTVPTVRSTVPANAATGASVSSPFTATFNQAMDPSTINTATIQVAGPGAMPVAGVVTYAGSTATFTPASTLAGNTVYSATITAGAIDLDGHALASNYGWTFTTGALPDSAPTVSSTVPMNAAIGASVSSPFSATFNKAMGPATLTTDTMQMTGPGNTPVAGVVTYTGTTATFTPAHMLAGNTVYTGTITTGAQDLAGTGLAGNYGWTFTTGALPDTAPTVSATVPMNAATNASVSTPCTATFNKAMVAATLNTATMQVSGPGATPVAGVVTFAGTSATFMPAGTLARNTVYTATITTGAQDLAGNGLAANYGWTFTTGALPDTAPTVNATVPLNTATDVPVNSACMATFSKPMDPATLNATSMLVTGPGTTPVDGVVTYAGSTATFTPTNALASDVVYTATITTGAKDLAGTALTNNYGWTFNSVKVVTILVPVTPDPTVPATVTKLVTNPNNVDKTVILALEDVHFNFDKSILTENAQIILKNCVKILKDNPKIHLRIAGYTSASGSKDYDMALSQRRADAVRDYLVHEGVISADRLTVIGFGKKDPAEYEAAPKDLYSTEAKANMRVMFEIIVK